MNYVLSWAKYLLETEFKLRFVLKKRFESYRPSEADLNKEDCPLLKLTSSRKVTTDSFSTCSHKYR